MSDKKSQENRDIRFLLNNRTYNLKNILKEDYRPPIKGEGPTESPREWKIVKRRKKSHYKKQIKYNPITSYGIILFTIDSEGTIFYLTVQRRDTIEYVDFIRGQYNYKSIRLLFDLMSEEERLRILHHTFDELWSDLWINRSHRIYRECYDKARYKFDKICREIPSILDETSTVVTEPSWIFPKGKKNIKESSIQCAFREFMEETRMAVDDVYLFNEKPFVETFRGSNNKLYSTQYYVAYTPEKIEINRFETDGVVRNDKFTVSEEIANMKWFTLQESSDHLNDRRRKLISEVDTFIKERLMNSIL